MKQAPFVNITKNFEYFGAGVILVLIHNDNRLRWLLSKCSVILMPGSNDQLATKMVGDSKKMNLGYAHSLTQRRTFLC